MWKTNWDETRERFEAWWNRRGLLVSSWGSGFPLDAGTPAHEVVERSPPARDPAQRHRDPAWLARHWRAKMAGSDWPADLMPAAWPDVGTVSTAVYLGAGEHYGPDNIWYEPCVADLASAPRLGADFESRAARAIHAVVRETVAAARGDFLVGMPAIISGLDVLAALRGEEGLLMDMALEPHVVLRRLDEIRPGYQAVFDSLRELTRAPDDTMCFGYFMLWGKGRVGLCQCDLAAMFSRAMFDELALPDLRAQARFLDHSMYHVDGKQAVEHVDSILTVEELDAVELTPDPTSPPAGDPSWYPLYRKILDAGKSVWIAQVKPDAVKPLLKHIGKEGVYLTVAVRGAEEMRRVEREARRG